MMKRLLKMAASMLVATAMLTALTIAEAPEVSEEFIISGDIDLSAATARTLDEFYDHYYQVTGKEWDGPRSNAARGYIDYRVISTEKHLGAGYDVEMGCMMEVGVGQSSSWNRVDGDVYCVASSSGQWQWSNAVQPKATLSSTKKYVSFVGRGQATVETTSSHAAGFEAAGFSYQQSTDNTMYDRKLADVRATVYQ